ASCRTKSILDRPHTILCLFVLLLLLRHCRCFPATALRFAHRTLPLNWQPLDRDRESRTRAGRRVLNFLTSGSRSPRPATACPCHTRSEPMPDRCPISRRGLSGPSSHPLDATIHPPRRAPIACNSSAEARPPNKTKERWRLFRYLETVLQ